MPPVPELSAKLIFPTKEIVEEYYLPIIYTACRTCYSELEPQDIFVESDRFGELAGPNVEMIEHAHAHTVSLPFISKD